MMVVCLVCVGLSVTFKEWNNAFSFAFATHIARKQHTFPTRRAEQWWPTACTHRAEFAGIIWSSGVSSLRNLIDMMMVFDWPPWNIDFVAMYE